MFPRKRTNPARKVQLQSKEDLGQKDLSLWNLSLNQPILLFFVFLILIHIRAQLVDRTFTFQVRRVT